MTFLGQQIIESVIKYFQSISCYVFGKLSTFNYTTCRTNCTCKAKIFIISTNTTNAQMYYHILSHSNFNALQWQIYPWKNSERKTIFSIQWRCNHTPSSTGVLDNTELQNPLLQNYHRNKTTTQKSIENRSSSFNSASVHLSGLALPLYLLIKKE